MNVRPSHLALVLTATLCTLPYVVSPDKSYAQARTPHVLSDRVGPEISSNERAYFDLFPRIQAFESARVQRLTDTSYVFVIRRSAPMSLDTALVTQAKAVDALGRYLDFFERSTWSGEKVPWQLLWPMVAPVRRVQNASRITVVCRDSSMASGYLVYLDKRGLLLAPGGGAESLMQAALAEAVHYIAPSDIELISIDFAPGRPLASHFMMPGVGNRPVFERYALPLLRRHAAFKGTPSPELDAYLNARISASPVYLAENAEIDPRYLNSLRSRLHLSLGSFGIGSFTRPRTFQVLSTHTFPATDPELPVPGPRTLRAAPLRYVVQADYNVKPRLQIGLLLGASSFPGMSPAFEDTVHWGPQVNLTDSLVTARSTGGSVDIGEAVLGAMATVLVKRHDPFGYLRGPLNMRNRFALRVSAGPTLAYLAASSFAVEGKYNQFREIYRYREGHKDHQLTWGGIGTIDLEYFAWRMLSINLGLRTLYLPSVRLPELTVHNPYAPDVNKTVPASSASIFIPSATIGLRLHLVRIIN